MTHRDMALRTAAGTLALATCLGGGALALAGTANAVAIPGPDDRVLVIASGDQAHTVDALAAAPFASVLGANILLTPATGPLAPQTKDYIVRARESGDPVDFIFIVGGDAAVSREATNSLTDLSGRGKPAMQTFAGADRYATAALLAAATDELVDAYSN